MARRLAAILAADVVGYSRLMGADETGTLERLKSLRKELMQPKIAAHGGRIVKLMGDGLLAEFPSVVEAVQCAADIQGQMVDHEAELFEEQRIRLRVGVNLGDIIVEGSDIYGDGVNVAARLEGLAEPGGVCISGAAFDAVEGKLDLAFEDLGLQPIKNISKPIRAYRLACETAQVGSPLRLVNPPQLPDKPSIAVLPFTNMSGDPEQEFFSDGITDDIITALCKIEKLFVIARNSTFTYKGQAVDVKRVGREQGVRYVLEGSVQRRGDRLRIAAQLIDATTGHHLWAERYDRESSDLFALQDEITREVAAALQVELTEGEQARMWASGTKNLEAWELAIQASVLLREHHRESVHEARRLAEQAVRLDENYAWAWMMLGGAHWTDALNEGWSESREASLALARKASDRAMAIDPSSPDSLMMRAMINLTEQKFDDAQALAEKALLLAPNHSHNTALAAIITLACGKLQTTIELSDKAIRLCPTFPSWYLVMKGRAYWAMGRMDDAIATAQSAITYDPDLSYAYLTLAKVFAEIGRDEEARRAAAEVLRIDPGFSVRAWAEGMPYRDAALRSRQIGALRKAGLPE